MVFVLKNILKYERIVMIMVLYNKVVVYEIIEWVYINFDMKKKIIKCCIMNLWD